MIVVDVLEAIDIQEGDDESRAGAPYALEFAPDLVEPEPAHPGARQFVPVRQL